MYYHDDDPAPLPLLNPGLAERQAHEDRYLDAPYYHDRTRDKFAPCIVRVRMENPKHLAPAPFDAIAIGNYAVHRTLKAGEPTGHGWKITHLPSGLGASTSPIALNYRQARQLAKAYHEHGPDPEYHGTPACIAKLTRHIKPVFCAFFFPLFPKDSKRAALLRAGMIDAQSPLCKIGAPLCPSIQDGPEHATCHTCPNVTETRAGQPRADYVVIRPKS
jgi:hypothetical protein